MQTYTVTEAAQKLNLSAKTLRRWEETGRFVSNRTFGGQRRYTTEDLQILDAIKQNIISSQSDLLTKQQAAQEAGVSEDTIAQLEAEGKLHTFITSNNVYFIKSHLLQDLQQIPHHYQPQHSHPHITTPTPSSLSPSQQMDELEANTPSFPSPTPTSPNPSLTKTSTNAQATSSSFSNPRPLRLTPLYLNSPSNLSQTQIKSPLTATSTPSWRHDLKLTILNIIITTTLLTGYHLLTTQPKTTPPSPAPSGAVQGASTINDPKLDTLKNLIDQVGNFNTAGSVRVGGQLTTPRFILAPTTRPGKPVAGTLYFDASASTLEFFNGNDWQILASTPPSPSPSPNTNTQTKLTPLDQSLR